jgi:exopolysaccharide biosynthesis polyprenyl glycosylphosphotransferase
MASSRDKGLPQLLTLLQVMLVVGIYSAGAFLVLSELPERSDFGRAYFKYGVVVVAALLFEAWTRPQNLRTSVARARFQAGAISVRQLVFAVFGITLLLVYSRDQRLSRLFLAGFGVLSYTALYLSNRYAIAWLNRLGSRYIDRWRPRTVLLGPAEWCEMVVPHLKSQESSINLCEVIPIEDPEADGTAYLDKIAGTDIDLLVLHPRPCRGVTGIDFIRLGDRMGFRCWLPVEISLRHGRSFDLRRVGSIDVATPPIEPLEDSANQLVKRIFDLCFCLPVVLLVLPPLCALVWVIHRFYSPGPLFFCQDRVGRNGALFKVIKFRTLHVMNENEAKQVTKDDSRIFRFGGLLRRLSLDEFPQFLNVLRGEMSIVGPRPHMEAHDVQFREIFERYGVRRYVKPGVTGLAQVKGYRGEITRPVELRHRAKLDNFYVANWSLTLDVKIVLLTVWTVFSPPKTAY